MSFFLMQTRASKLWLTGRWVEGAVSLSPSGIAKSHFKYISIHYKLHLEGSRKSQDLYLKAFKEFDDTQFSLIVCQQEANPRGLQKSHSFALFREQRQADRSSNLKIWLPYFIISNLHQNPIMIWQWWNANFKRKGYQETELWDSWEHRLYRPLSRTTLLLTLLPFKVKVRCPPGSPLSNSLILNEGEKLWLTEYST